MEHEFLEAPHQVPVLPPTTHWSVGWQPYEAMVAK